MAHALLSFMDRHQNIGLQCGNMSIVMMVYEVSVHLFAKTTSLFILHWKVLLFGCIHLCAYAHTTYGFFLTSS